MCSAQVGQRRVHDAGAVREADGSAEESLGGHERQEAAGERAEAARAREQVRAREVRAHEAAHQGVPRPRRGDQRASQERRDRVQRAIRHSG